MAHFILINPSIKGIGGHCLEYAIHVLAAAKRAGYKPVLGTHRMLTETAMNAILQANVVEAEHLIAVCQYEHCIRPEEWPWLHLINRLGRTVFGIGNLLKRSPDLGEQVAKIAKSPLDLSVSDSRKSFATSVATRLRRGHAMLFETAAAQYYSWASWATHRAKADSFYGSLSEILRNLEISDGDLVFIPDVSWAEVDGVRRFITENPAALRATWHLVLRYNLFRGHEPDYPSQVRQFSHARRILHSFETLFEAGVVRFHCDTQELCEQYGRLSSIKFASLPIPHTSSVPENVPSLFPNSPLRVVYLGDARAEKGYRQLPRLVRDMWPEYVAKDRLVFSIQSNFNTVGGGPGIAEARAELRRFPPEKVDVLCEPLQSRDYQRLMHSGQISLVLYDAAAYYARSSGILAESLAAGMTVLATAGTWAATQFADAVRGHQVAMRQNAEVLSSVGDSSDRSPNMPLSVGGPATPWQSDHNIPINANALFGNFSGLANPGQFLKVRIALADAEGTIVSVRHATVGPLTSGKTHHFLLPLDHSATSISIRCWNAFDCRPITLPQWSIEFLKCASSEKGFPRSAVGLAVADPEDTAELLKELIDHFPHYHNTAKHFAASFFQWHNAERLVNQLATSATKIS